MKIFKSDKLLGVLTNIDFGDKFSIVDFVYEIPELKSSFIAINTDQDFLSLGKS